MKVFLDTNIILDFYDSSRGHYMPSAIIFDLAIKGKIQLAVCSQSFITAFYLLRKSYKKEELYKSMKSLFKLCQVSAVDSLIIKKALSREGLDFEDTVQYFSARSIDADIIITRDSKGFNEFDIRHITAEEFLDEYLAKLT
jgi:predicted nucleic acid-binding protein